MKKVIVHKIVQKNVSFYAMIADPRLVVALRRKYVAGEAQDVQRPWMENKVKEISSYVAGKSKIENKKALGLIPNAPIINVKGGLKVQRETVRVKDESGENEHEQFFIMFPETPEEIQKHENELEIIDGQHRIIAFDVDHIDPDFGSNVNYEMVFSVFDNLTDNQRKELFMVTNEKQDKVATNLLRYIKKSLGLLVGDDEITYDLLEAINNESSSPLYGRIMFGADKVKKGYQETQMSKIFRMYGAKKFYDNVVVPEYKSEAIEKFVVIVSNYLAAWEELSNVSFQQPGADTITKISGLRYLLYVFSEICEALLKSGKKLTKENFKEFISGYAHALQLENIKCVFCDDWGEDSEGAMMERSLAFRGEGATIALAKKDLQAVLANQNTRTAGGLL